MAVSRLPTGPRVGGVPGKKKPKKVVKPDGRQHLVGNAGAQPGNADTYRDLKNKRINRTRRATQAKRDKVAPIDNNRERVADRGRPGNFPKRPVVKRPKAPTAPPPRGRGVPSAGAPRPTSGGGGGGGGASTGPANSGSSGGGGRAPRTVRRPPKNTTGGGGASSGGGGAQQTEADTTANSIMKEYFGPALDELKRQEAEALNTRNLQIQDTERLRQWMAQQNTDAENFLSKSLAAGQAMPQGPSMLAEAQARAAAAVGGNVDLMRAAGIDAANAAQAAQAPGDAAARAMPQLQSAAFSRGMADQRGVTASTMSNLQTGVNVGYNDRLSKLGTERAKLSMSAADMLQKEKAAQRTAAQDDRMFQLIAREKLGNLEVAKTNAATKRIQVITTAENARAGQQLKAQIEAGRMSRQDARDAFDQKLKSQNLSLAKRKLELARFDAETKRIKTGGADISKLSDYVAGRYDNYLKQYNTTQWDAIPRDQQRKVVRNIVTGLRGAGGANLSQDQALAILGGVLGDIPVRDPAFRRMVTALWPR